MIMDYRKEGAYTVVFIQSNFIVCGVETVLFFLLDLEKAKLAFPFLL